MPVFWFCFISMTLDTYNSKLQYINLEDWQTLKMTKIDISWMDCGQVKMGTQGIWLVVDGGGDY